MTKNTDSLIVELDTGGSSEIGFRATGVAEYWRSQGVEELGVGESEQTLDRVFPRPIDITIETKSAEPVPMDAARQKLELDITQEFEVADGEATRLIDEAG